MMEHSTGTAHPTVGTHVSETSALSGRRQLWECENECSPRLKAVFGERQQPVNTEASMRTLMTEPVLFGLIRASDRDVKKLNFQLHMRRSFCFPSLHGSMPLQTLFENLWV